MKSTRLKLGLDVFLENHVNLVKSRRIGLITNQTGVSSFIESTAELFGAHPEINLVALFGPEHGVRGDAQAGEYVPFKFDEKLKVPVYSLYGQTQTKETDYIQNIDETMRAFDTRESEKSPAGEMLRDIDVLVFDIQDVGTRIYTYLATMAYSMQAASIENISFFILDRPNPINGVTLEGPILDYPTFSSFVGLYPIPVRHGMTLGELGDFINQNYLDPKVDLTVIPMQNWRREMWYDQTGLRWIAPSPNMPTLATATVYPGQVFLEGTNISEGRGTSKPFEYFGAPWIDGHALSKELERLSGPEIEFDAVEFNPTFSKYEGSVCRGCCIRVLDRETYAPLKTSLRIIKTVMELYPEHFAFHVDYFDKIMGSSRVREELERGSDFAETIGSFLADVLEFRDIRRPFLLY